MTLHWTDIALFVAIAAAGSGTVYFLLLRQFERRFAAGYRDMEHRLAALTEAISMLEPATNEAIPVTDALGATEMEVALTADKEVIPPNSGELRAGAESEHSRDGDIPPEIRVAITAAAIAAFGNHARVRSARRVPSSDVVSPWTQQGRVIVQSSHNLRTRG